MRVGQEATRVSFFLVSLNGGGAERVMVTLANTMASIGISVDLVVGNADGPYAREISDKVNLINLKKERLLKCFWPLVKHLKITKPHLLFTTLDYVNIVSIVANFVAGKPAKVMIREASTFSKNIKTASFVVRFFLPYLMKFLYPFADGIVAVSNGVKEDLVESLCIPEKKIKVIFNPIDCTELVKLANQKVSHRWLTADERNYPVILAVGRFVPAKDYETLIRAFVLLLKLKKAKLIILGDGPELSKINDLVKKLGIEDWVDFPGFVANPFPYMYQSDVFVLSSKYEGMPNSLLQATILGCKVVSTNCKSGPSEILANGKYGKLVTVGDVNGMANAIFSMLEQEPSSPKIRHLAQYDAQKIALEFLSLSLE